MLKANLNKVDFPETKVGSSSKVNINIANDSIVEPVSLSISPPQFTINSTAVKSNIIEHDTNNIENITKINGRNWYILVKDNALEIKVIGTDTTIATQSVTVNGYVRDTSIVASETFDDKVIIFIGMGDTVYSWIFQGGTALMFSKIVTFTGTNTPSIDAVGSTYDMIATLDGNLYISVEDGNDDWL